MNEDEQRWQQVIARQEPARPFLYAVRTTGIFCRPTCPSRRPRRENTTFFETVADAQAAGFRACLRCAPEQSIVPTADVEAVTQACREMVRAGGPLPSGELARAAGVGERSLARAFGRTVGVTPRAFGNAVRTGSARALLQEHQDVGRAVFDAGFGSVRAFYDTAAPTLGMTPSSYAAGGKNEHLTWASTTTTVGTLVAVASPRGLCAVRIGPDVDTLLAEVREEFPAAHVTPDHDGLADVVDALAALAAGSSTGRSLPLDLRGTAFQARVWTALTRIPAGQTRSYRDVAVDVGAPAAVRAVARACASNRLALVVPCHRVIRSDGGLGGYRWGLSVKQSLLDAEHDAAVTSGKATSRQDGGTPRRAAVAG